MGYTTFEYTDLTITQHQSGEPVEVSLNVTNTGSRAGDEVVQLYWRTPDAAGPGPLRQLIGFTRLHLDPGQAQTVRFDIMPEQVAHFDDTLDSARDWLAQVDVLRCNSGSCQILNLTCVK